MNARWRRLGIAAAAPFLTTVGFAAEPVTPPAPLRYLWAQVGPRLAYTVEIEIDHGDELETQKGTVFISVAPGSEGQALVSLPPLRLASQRTLKPGRNPVVPGFGPPVPRIPVVGPPGFGAFDGHELKLDGRGRVISERGESQLPFALGALVPLVFQPLPEAAEARWQRTQETSIRITADWPFHSPLRAGTETGRYSAEAVTICDVRALTEAGVEIARTYSLKTVQTIEGEPVMELTGAGTIVLDRNRGVPTEVTYALRFQEREDNREQRYPIRFACKLLDEAELRTQGEQAEAARAAAAAAAAARRAPPTPAEREALLADLQSADKERARRAMNILRHKAPEKPDGTLAEALAGWLENGDPFVRQLAVETLANWATPAEIPALLKVLEGNGFDARAAGRLLGDLREKRAVPILAAKLSDTSWRFEAGSALRAIGSPAENAVLKLLKDKDWGVRLEVCRVLQQIGTTDSLKALDAVAAADENPLVQQTAILAAQAIRAR
jgi:hypothetical protein